MFVTLNSLTLLNTGSNLNPIIEEPKNIIEFTTENINIPAECKYYSISEDLNLDKGFTVLHMNVRSPAHRRGGGRVSAPPPEVF